MIDFSVIIYLQNPETSKDTEQSLSHLDSNVQVLTYDAANLTIADAFNTGKQQAEGKYICFIDDDAVYDEGSFEAVKEAFEMDPSIDAVSLRPVYISPQEGEQPYVVVPQKSGIYSVTDGSYAFPFNLKGYFFPRQEAAGIEFDNGLGTECCSKFLIDYFLVHDRFQYIAEKSVKYQKAAECDHSNFADQLGKNWYFHNVESLLLEYAKKTAEVQEEKKTWLQLLVYYLLTVRFVNNYLNKNKEVLDKNEAYKFFDLAGEVLKYIDDNIIMTRIRLEGHSMDRVLRLLLMRLKFRALGIPYRLTEQDGFFCFDYGDSSSAKMINTSKEKANLHTMHYENGCIDFDFRISADKIFDKDNITVKVISDGKEAQLREIMDYPLIQCFGVTVMRRYGGHACVPVDFSKKEQKIKFYFTYQGKDYPMSVRGDRNASKVGGSGSYWRFCPGRIIYPEGNTLIIRQVSTLQLLKKEYAFAKKCIKESDDGEIRKKILHRWGMMLARRFNKQRIWVTFDKIYKAGDNGEYMYHYIHDNVQDVKIYYVLEEGSADYERMKKEGANILIPDTWKCHRALAKAEVILATHPSIWQYSGFKKEDIPLYKDLLLAELVCIQHGLTTMNIAQYQCRIYDDTRLYCCAADCEAENIKRPIFGYDDSQIRMTGLARFDGLRNADKKQILITPTWRRNVVNAGIAFDKKKHNENFRSTEYFRIFNSLINDQKLINCARANGYRIIYLLHPAMSSQIDDYDRNDYVELVQATGDMNYEKILTESSLMITDYSSIQFDFAYMRKPIIYYHPETLPPQYEEGVYKYETMGFGPIARKHEELIDTICNYLADGCAIKEKYSRKADDFFMFDDYNNCKRIYAAVDQWIQEIYGRRSNESLYTDDDGREWN